MTIIESLYRYMVDCPVLEELATLKIDYLPNLAESCSLEPTPTQAVNQWYINGSSEREYQFIIATRFSYSEESILTMSNSGFFEHLQDWFEIQTDEGNLPVLDNGRVATSIEALTTGYLFAQDSDMRDARYQIQCVLRYTQRKEG